LVSSLAFVVLLVVAVFAIDFAARWRREQSARRRGDDE
jgi:hypothetical protein